MKDQFFAAANTGRGFESDFPEIFSPEKFKRIYIIKGGPGTGKSTFMKKLGEEAARRGYAVGYCYCSSDVSSLDGVIIKELSVAVIDGTAPHTTDPIYPGACEVILNFGEAFDLASLAARRAEIERATRLASEHYRRAYRALESAKAFFDGEMTAARGAFLHKKAERYVSRLFSQAPPGEITYRRTKTVCRRGEYRLPIALCGERIIAVPHYHGVGRLILSAAAEYAKNHGLSATIYRDALCPDVPDAVICGGACLIAEGEDVDSAEKKLNPRRFADEYLMRAERGYARLCEKLGRDALLCAVSELGEAGRYHDELEKIYVQNTDFSVIDKMLEATKREVFEKSGVKNRKSD